MTAQKVRDLLDRNHVKYLTIKHSPAYTSQEVAGVTHLPGKEIAKTVIVMIDGKPAMVVLPASKRVSLETVCAIVGGGNVRLALESELLHLFPDCEIGAMPPFGNLYGLEVYVDANLADDELIAFNAGNHSELIQMRYVDFARLAAPVIAALATR